MNSSPETIPREQIFDVALTHMMRTGNWPAARDEYIWRRLENGAWEVVPNLPWSVFEEILKKGGSSLEQMGRDNNVKERRLTREKVISWCEQFYEKCGRYPTILDDDVWEKNEDDEWVRVKGQDWNLIDEALCEGLWGLSPDDSLGKLLLDNFGYRRSLTKEWLSHLSELFYKKVGRLPSVNDLLVYENNSEGDWTVLWDERWRKINKELVHEGEQLGLPPHLALFHHEYLRHLMDANAITVYRQIKSRRERENRKISEEQIVRWCFLHVEKTGKWPTGADREVWEKDEAGNWRPVEDEMWYNIKADLRLGRRNLEQGSSLEKLKEKHYTLTKEKIAYWCELFCEKNNRLPSEADMDVWDKDEKGEWVQVPGENWDKIGGYLKYGRRGFKPGGSLTKLKLEFFSLTRDQLAKWCFDTFEITGNWPTAVHEPVWEKDSNGSARKVHGRFWDNVDQYLRYGRHGLPKGGSLKELKLEYFGADYKTPTRSGGGGGWAKLAALECNAS